MNRLADRAILITGAAGGIGRACARQTAAEGAVVAVAARTLAAAEEVVEELEAAGGKAVAVAGDLEQPGAGPALVADAVGRLGRLDGVVNVAGAQCRKPALELTEADWDRLAAVNLRATFFVAQAAAKAMTADGHGGCIVNITSLTAFIGVRDVAAYVATRGGGVNQLTKALATEWAPLGIRVNAVAPGRIRTAMTEAVFADDEVRAGFERLIPMGRGGAPDEVSGSVVFLLSDEARYVTGHTIVVDGGWLAAGGVTR